MKLKNRLIFISHILLPCFLVYFLYFTVERYYIYPRTNIHSSKLIIKNHYIQKSIPSVVDFLVLGDSSGLYAINPTFFSEQSYSAANVGGTIFSSYNTLTSLFHIQITKGILLTQTFIREHYDEDIWSTLVPSRQIELKEIFELLCMHELTSCSLITKIKLTFNYYASFFYLNSEATSQLSNFIRNINDLNLSNLTNWYRENIEKNHGHYASPVYKSLSDRNFKAPYINFFSKNIPEIPKAEIEYLHKIAQFANQRKIKLYFVIAPLETRTQGNEESKYQIDLNKILKLVAAEGYIIIDGNAFSDQLSKDDFIDFNHLNKRGADKFSRHLAMKIKQE